MKKEAEGLKPAKPAKEYSKDPYVQQKFVKELNAVLGNLKDFAPDKLLSYEQMSTLLYILLLPRLTENH